MKRYVLILFVFLTCACNSKKQHEYQYDEALFVSVITDLYFAEQVVRNHNVQKDSVRNALKEQIFEIHEIADTAKFMSELTILMKDSDYYIPIHDSIIAVFDKKNDNYQTKKR